MRFLNTSTYEITTDDDPQFRNDPRYAILSHRWVGQEITLQTLRPADLLDLNLNTPQLNKIRGACSIARQETPPIKWLWDDTCCIDKTNSVEEARSINSMFKWYRNATVCYAYLHDVTRSAPGTQMFKSQDPRRKQNDLESEWFERGWTLQELLSPRHLNFFDRGWNFMGSKKDLAGILQRVTGIDARYLTGERRIQEASIATKMSWMAGRITKEIEDIAYSMLGLLGIAMMPLYGEGTKAFMRLQKTLIESSPDESIFAWTTPAEGLACFQEFGQTPKFSPQNWGMLAPSPDCFKQSGDIVVFPDRVVPRLNGGYRWVQQGVQFDMGVAANTEASNFFGQPRSNINLPLNCWRVGPDGKVYTIVIDLVQANHTYVREKCNVLGHKKNAKPSTNRVMGVDQMLTRALTVTQPDLDSF